MGGSEPIAKVPVDVEVAPAEAARWIDGSEPTADTHPDGNTALAPGDGNLGDMIWDRERCLIIDFEDSGRGDRAYGPPDLTEHVTVSSRRLLDPDRLLRTGRLGRRSAGYVTYRRTFAAYWLFTLLPGNPAHHRNAAGSVSLRARHVPGLLG